jgi:hypothetical protein
MPAKSSLIRKAATVMAVVLMAITLSGCVIVPAGGGYYHPHHWGY